MTVEKIKSHCELLAQWFDNNGWAGDDPYDILGLPPFITLLKNKYTRFACHKINELFPHFLRRLYRFKRAVNPKTVALLALAYQNLFRATRSSRWATESKKCLDWLENNSSTGYDNFCWGYPFDWQSVSFVPRGTPSSVVTAICIDAFLTGYELFHTERYLKIAEGAAQFLLTDLQIDTLDDQRLCFSYTPIDNLHVHNANLWTAYALCRTGTTIDDASLIEKAMPAVHYSLEGQEADGSWDYFGPPDGPVNKVDTYHTGFVLRCLYGIYQLVKDPAVLKAVQRGHDFFLENLIIGRRVPRFRQDRKYPVDIHACSEAILCLTELSEDFPEGLDVACTIASWTVDNMSDSHGQFYYRKYPLYTIKTPYIRWGQAWMFLALSKLLCVSRIS
jgi:rhamnogalacturonyl hydrolase YesR